MTCAGPAGHRVDHSGGPLGRRDQGVHQRGLAHAGLPDEHAEAAGEPAADLGQRAGRQRPPGGQHGQVQRGVQGADLARRRLRGQVGLGQQEQRVQPGVERRDQAAVDEAEPRRRLGQRADDHHLIGVGHDDPLRRVGVVRRAPQRAGPRFHPDDPGQRPALAGRVPGQRDPVADHHRAFAQFAGLHGHHQAVVGHAAVPAAVHRDDEACRGGRVRRAPPGARPRAAPGTDPDVVLVEVGVARPGAHREVPGSSSPASMPVHTAVNPGKVLATVCALATRRPGTRRPSTAAAITIRWSS